MEFHCSYCENSISINSQTLSKTSSDDMETLFFSGQPIEDSGLPYSITELAELLNQQQNNWKATVNINCEDSFLEIKCPVCLNQDEILPTNLPELMTNVALTLFKVLEKLEEQTRLLKSIRRNQRRNR